MRIAVFAFALSLMWCTVVLTAAERRKSTIHTATIEGMKCQPDELTVASGDVVVWVNKDLVAHTATSTETGIFDSKLIAPEKSWKFTAREKRDLAYGCTYHPTMKAILHVE
jgi:plastocyanin